MCTGSSRAASSSSAVWTSPNETGLLGHSDADVLTHAVMDALLGAAAMGDIGHLFPDNDPAYAGADSLALLREVTARLHAAGYTVSNLDCTVLAQTPKLARHIAQIDAAIWRQCMDVDVDRVSVKATTEEGLGLHRHARGHRRARGRPDRTDFVNACAAPA